MMRFAQIPFVFLAVLSCLLPGCAGSWLRPQDREASLEKLAEEQEESNLIASYTHPIGLNFVKVEAISLCTSLHGTGGDPPPGSQRAALLEEMKRRQVPNPNQVLASDKNALVLLRSFLPPGVQKGDRVDVEVRVPSRSEASSLAGGWVLPARLAEKAVLGEQVHSGHELAMCEGPVLVDGVAADEDQPSLTRGRILGGGVALKSRSLGLVIDQERRSVRVSTAISKAINQRFYHYRDGRRVGLATPKTDEYIELALHDRYKENITRFVRVIRNLTIDESASELQTRLVSLRRQLLDPLTTAKAALRLEAVGGDQAAEILEEGIESEDPEVRFYSAEALAYLDRTSAVESLAEAARKEPAFRVNALAALSAMEDIVAYDALRGLLDVSSAETRYGAFRALWAMNRNDPLVRGEQLGDRFSYHRLDVGGPAMVHITRSHRPEIVLFGANQRLKMPLVLDAGQNILVNGMQGDTVTVSRFVDGEPDQQREVEPTVDAIVRAIVELGGGYPDVVQALLQAKQDGAMESRFRADALPQPGRAYQREDEPLPPEEAGAAPYSLATPLPDLFGRKDSTE